MAPVDMVDFTARRRLRSDEGIALVVVLVLLVALLGLTSSIVPLTTLEMTVSANHRRSTQMQYAAEAAVEHAVQELVDIADWGSVLRGQRVSRLGSATGVEMADGQILDTASGGAGGAGRGPSRAGSPHGRRWQIFLLATFDDIVGFETDGLLHVAVWLSDDIGDPDNDVLRDANETVVLYGACFGPAGAQRAVRVSVHRREAEWVEVLTWRVVR